MPRFVAVADVALWGAGTELGALLEAQVPATVVEEVKATLYLSCLVAAGPPAGPASLAPFPRG